MNNILYILVIYQCKLEQSASLQSIGRALEKSEQTAGLFIFDNSPNSQEINELNTNVWEHVIYTHAAQNPGLGVAYNSGAQYAAKHGYSWIVLLDQDTQFGPNFDIELRKSIEKHPHIGLFAPKILLKDGHPFSPAIYKFKQAKAVILDSGLYSLLRYSPVNSGMAINIKQFMKVGGYEPNIRLDFADFQFIEKYSQLYSDFFVLDSCAYQDFSFHETNTSKQLTRFRIYCQCARNCKKRVIIDHLFYFLTVTQHTLVLLLKTKKPDFLKIYLLEYLFYLNRSKG